MKTIKRGQDIYDLQHYSAGTCGGGVGVGEGAYYRRPREDGLSAGPDLCLSLSLPGTLCSLSLEVTPDRGLICPIHICSLSKTKKKTKKAMVGWRTGQSVCTVTAPESLMQSGGHAKEHMQWPVKKCLWLHQGWLVSCTPPRVHVRSTV